MTSLEKKSFTAVSVIAIATLVAFNLNIKTVDTGVDVTLSNIDVLAGETRGNFPACQKNKGSGDRSLIPFCVNGSCKQTEENKGTLDVNYCSE